MISMLERTPVLSLTPDSISQLGNLDSSSLSELWGVFTKCKDSLKDGRRLENLSWRLWFDSGRRELHLSCGEETEKEGKRERESNLIEPSHSNSEVDWSDPEWSEASSSDSEGDSSILPPLRSTRSEKVPTTSSATISSDRSNFNNDNGESTNTTATTMLPPCTRPSTGRVNSGGLRTACPLTGGSLQRMIIGLTTLPAITSYAHNHLTPLPPTPPFNVIEPLSTPSPSSTVAFTTHNLPPPLIAVPEITTKVDAPTQTTPSTSHRPSPAMKSPIALRRLSNQLPSPQSFVKSISSTVSISTSSTTTGTGMSKPSLSRRNTSNVLTAAAQQENARSLARGNSEIQLKRNESFEPRSYVKGFDTTIFESRPTQGSIAPPPTPATKADLPLSPPPLSHRNTTATPPPSAMKSLTGIKKLPVTTSNAKKIFFISSHSDSEEDGSSSISIGSTSNLEGRRKKSNTNTTTTNSGSFRSSSSIPFEKIPPPPPNSVSDHHPVASTSRLPPISTSSTNTKTQSRTSAPTPTTTANAASADEWDDEDSSATEEEEEEDDESSGWGSEYSTESESRATAAVSTAATALPAVEKRPKALFAKRDSLPISSGSNPISELKPRPPGLLSQLFHPDLTSSLGMNDRSRSELDIRNGKREGLHSSKSAGVLTEQLRNKSFLRGAPVGTEMDSSSEEEDGDGENGGEGGGSDGFEDEESGTSSTQNQNQNQNQGEARQTQAVSNALYRQQQSQRQLEQLTTATLPIAPPQTPRTTRRAMLATELSESLRRNLLWERQTRNRIMGGPLNARFLPAETLIVAPTTTTSTVQASAQPQAETSNKSKGSKSTSTSSVPPILRRRNTTGTGLYLEGQMKKLAKGHGGGGISSTIIKKSNEEEDLSEESETELEGGNKSRGDGEMNSTTTSSFTGGVHSHGW